MASTLQVVAGGVSIAVAATTAILSRLKFGELSENHLASRRAYVRLKRRMDVLVGVRKLALIADADGEKGSMVVKGQMHPDWKAFLEDWDTVLNDAPPMSLAMQAELYRRKITAQATEGALDIEGGLPDLASAGVSAAAAASAALSQGVEMGSRLLEKGRTTSEGRA